jgi:hypothetical protein
MAFSTQTLYVEQLSRANNERPREGDAGSNGCGTGSYTLTESTDVPTGALAASAERYQSSLRYWLK